MHQVTPETREYKTVRLRLVRCKSNSEYKMNSRKEIKIRAFGSVMENSPKNDFQCLVTFWKCYFPTNFSHFLNHFLSFQTNFISENFKIYTFNTTKNQNKNIFRTYTSYISGRRSKKEGEIEGTRDRSGKRDRSLAAATIFSGGQRDWSWVVTMRTRCKTPI